MLQMSEVLQSLKGHYVPVDSHEDTQNAGLESHVGDWHNTTLRRPDRSRRWILLSSCLAILNVVQLLRPLSPSVFGVNHARNTFDTGFATDFEDARGVIELEERNFTGWISYNATEKDVYRVWDPNEPQYFGSPSEQMDAAWDELLYGQYVAMTEEEASRYPGIVTSGTTGNYHMQPDVYHSLHCLNSIRMELEPEYYAKHPRPDADVPVPKSWDMVHRDHCLDQIRQSLMCFGDLSPAPFAAWDGFHLSIAEGRTHTCRKWEGISDWVRVRDQYSPSVPGD
ncbi:hypothetical protein ACN47E_004944 [Coniothyrium glycines]